MRNETQIIFDQIKAAAKPENIERIRYFFKEPVKLMGLMNPEIKLVVKNNGKLIKSLRHNDALMVIAELMQTGYQETIAVAIGLLDKIHRKYQMSDFEIFENWLYSYISNWANCDDFSHTCIGELIRMYPMLARRTYKWTKSENRWVRRGAPVAFVMLARQGLFLDDVFAISDLLIHDTDEMVIKGYGWALKNAGIVAPQRVFDFISARRNIMPRIAFRYAIEKFSPEMRAVAMKL